MLLVLVCIKRVLLYASPYTSGCNANEGVGLIFYFLLAARSHAAPSLLWIAFARLVPVRLLMPLHRCCCCLLVQVSNKDASNAFKQMFAGSAKGKGSTAAGAKGKAAAAAASPAKQKPQQAKPEGKAPSKQQGKAAAAAADTLLQDNEEQQQQQQSDAEQADEADAAAAAAVAGDSDAADAAAAAGDSDSADEEMEDLEAEGDEDGDAEAADEEEADEQAKFKAAFKQAPAGKQKKGKKAAANSSAVEGVGTGALAAAKHAVTVDVKKLITWKEGAPVPYAFLAETFEVICT
jgi:hypothetical protein